MSSYKDNSEISSKNTDDKDEYEINQNPCFYCPFFDNAEAQSRQYHHPIRRKRRPYYPHHFVPHYYYDDYYDDYDYYD